MMEELHIASRLLSAALDRYLAACSAVAGYYDSSNRLKGTSRAIRDVIPGELELVGSYEAKIKQARTIVGRVRNMIPAVAPVNILPADILTQIFQLILNAQPCYFKDQVAKQLGPPTFPETLSHVCSHWRRIAIDSRVLWSHIDLTPSEPSQLSKQLLSRGSVFAARAGHSPLDLHISSRASDRFLDVASDSDLDAFCASVGTRIRSLNLSALGSFPDFYVSVLNSCLTHCTPRTLNKLVVTANSNGLYYDEADTSNVQINENGQLLDVTRTWMEGLLPVRVLWLTGMHFGWASHVYHGLVELHLVPVQSGIRPDITQLELVGILAASPRLRVFHFGFMYHHNAPGLTATLNDLEVVNVLPIYFSQTPELLQILYPGPKPLQLSVKPLATLDLLSDELKQFFSRSNVTEFLINFSAIRPFALSLLELFGSLHMPNLQTLCLANVCLIPGTPREPEPPSTCSKLDTLYLAGCDIDLGELERVVRVVPVRTLQLAGCSTRYEEDDYIKAEKHELEITKIIPKVGFIPIQGSLENWDPWG